MKNKYFVRSHISEKKFRQILKCFSSDYTAKVTSEITGISRPTINNLYHRFRLRIVLIVDEGKFDGEVEVDEAYFGARRIRGKRGRGAKGKTPVVGLLKRNGKVYTQIVGKCTRKELMPVIKGKVLEDTTVYTDGWKSYDSLVLSGYRHKRIRHQKDEFARGRNHINGIESFWSYTKRRLNKFNGIHKDKFLLHLKESEYRWNKRTRSANIYEELMKNFRENPL